MTFKRSQGKKDVEIISDNKEVDNEHVNNTKLLKVLV